MKRLTLLFAVALVVCAVGAAQGVVVEMAPVGNPGNAADTRYETPGYGSVAHTYAIGKHEVTAGQYCEFLNAVASTADTYGLYHNEMWTGSYPCGIQQTPVSGGFVYTVASDWANRPVNWVAWDDAARFCNWLHNGQPRGPQGLLTTENGSYLLNGATTNEELMPVTRSAAATYVLPTEDEWYKAAYHDKNAGTAGTYFEWPTGTNAAPSNVLGDPTDPGNNATFCDYPVYTIGNPYYRTEVGAHENSESPYGTFDQAANVWEWNETDVSGERGIRGGSFNDSINFGASNRGSSYPAGRHLDFGFRVAQVPEPSTFVLLGAGAVGLLGFAWRRRAAMRRMMLGLAVLLAVPPGAAQAVTIDLVPVANPGNVGEGSGVDYGGYGPSRVCGTVSYSFQIGKFEVTAEQYKDFLNAVARTDAYNLYNPSMDTAVNSLGCNIKRLGSPGSYSYSVDAEWAQRPVNFVSWGDAARFANWLSNAQPTTGVQDLSTTENGSYYLNGSMTNAELMAVTRKAIATWVIPTEDEWYKAAYHKNDGVTGNYYKYPARADSVPSNVLSNPNADPGNNADYAVFSGGADHYTVGSPYYRTPVGDFEDSLSPYGTFDQGGNLWEWNEEVVNDSSRGLRGGSFQDYSGNLAALSRIFSEPSYNEHPHVGFRVASVPEPCSITLLVAGAVGALACARRWRKWPH